MEFVAIGVRTANKNPFSLCQIAVAQIDERLTKADIDLLLYTDSEFDRHLVRQHHINARSVNKAPDFGEVFPEVSRALSGRTVITYGSAAQYAIEEMCYRSNFKLPDCQWMDLSDTLSKALAHSHEIDNLDLQEAAQLLKVDTKRKRPYRWDASDEILLINSIFAHLISRVREKHQDKMGEASAAAQ